MTKETITTQTVEYEQRPFWQMLLMMIITVVSIGLCFIGLMWVAFKLLPNIVGSTVVIQSSEGQQYIQTTKNCYLNGEKINCTDPGVSLLESP